MSEAAPAFDVAGATDIGAVRKENQDAWTVVAAAERDEVALLLADGMGGHVGGGEAATGAIDAAAAALNENAGSAEAYVERLSEASRRASEAVAQLRARIGGSPGTTLVLALSNGDGVAAVANIGDSRAYLVSDGIARQLTDDHSWVAEQVRLGALGADEARHHMRRNIITRAVLGDDEQPDIFDAALRAGDTLVLCSDGVWEPLSDAQIASAFNAETPAQAAVSALCRMAIDAGSRDNVTVVAARRLR